MRPILLVVLAVVLVGCTRSNEFPEQPPAAVPTIDPACLARVEGQLAAWPAASGLAASGHRLTAPGDTPATADELGQVIKAQAAAWSALPGVTSVNLAADADGRVRLALDVEPCAVDLPTLVPRLIADTRTLVPTRELTIEVAGPWPKRRCTVGDQSCGPLPFEGDAAPVTGSRRPVMRSLAGGACQTDGDCQIAGCGNRCWAWNATVSVSTCEGYVFDDDIPWCGCVAARCEWFVAP